jgi:hypothetical protein
MQVVFHISSRWVENRFHTENQLSRLPGTAQILITSGVVWCCGGFFTDYDTTPTKVVLSCFVSLVGL